MLVGPEQPLDFLQDPEGSPSQFQRPKDTLAKLHSLASGCRSAAELSAVIYGMLRKHLDSPHVDEILLGIQFLASTGDPAGARLLGAMLEVAAPAQRLLPLVWNFSSSRRLWLNRLHDDLEPGCVLAEWRQRLHALAASCRDTLGPQKNLDAVIPDRIGWEDPWGAMRTQLSSLVQQALNGNVLVAEQRRTLVGLLGLEIDAWQERISHLAGSIDPFRVVAISRLLPILGKADADIRDLRHLVQLIAEGGDDDAFTNQRLRALEVMEEREFVALCAALAANPELRPLASLFQSQQENPLPVPILAHGVARVGAVGALLQSEGIPLANLDLLSTCRLIIANHGHGKVAMPVPREQLAKVESALCSVRGPRPSEVGPASWSLAGVEVQVGQLVITLPESIPVPVPWPEFLPTDQDMDPLLVKPRLSSLAVKPVLATEAKQKPGQDMNIAAMKNLVMTNIQSTSLLLGFLRNPKFVSIPGLVEAVATRTRNPRVVEVIAVDRTLYSGFANRGVPLACLRSPVNVSVKILRKFIHVKFISKMDLKRMAQDRAGIRKEVIREIEKYLEGLA